MSTVSVSTQPRLHTARVRGWQSPFSRDQLVATGLYPLLSSAFYLQGIHYLPHEQLLPVFLIYTVLLAISVSCWVYVESVDPSKPGGIGCPCMKYTQSNSRYCASCHKTVPGLDHHCLWLNTCIGTRNYFFFFVLAVAGTLQFTFQTLICLMLLTHWHPTRQRIDETLHGLVTYQVLTIIHVIAGVLALLSFGSLCCFHLYLQALGLGTYDWILSARSRQNGPSTTMSPAPISPPKSRRPEIELPKINSPAPSITTTTTYPSKDKAAMVSPVGNSPDTISDVTSTSPHVALTVGAPPPNTDETSPITQGDIETANP